MLIAGDAKHHTSGEVSSEKVSKVLAGIAEFVELVDLPITHVIPFILCLSDVAETSLPTFPQGVSCSPLKILSPETFTFLPYTPFLFWLPESSGSPKESDADETGEGE